MAGFFLGVVADDFTGASDAASFLAEAGVATVLYNGIPAKAETDDVQAMVIVLKTRTAPAGQAVEESLKAFSWLKEMGAEKLYFKYCSTFDSTSEGNIGPVIDGVLEWFHISYTVICPSLPVNGRTVKDGLLYVNGVLLENSPMRDHPLTPMRDSSLPRLLRTQGKYESVVVPLERLSEPTGVLAGDAGEHFYLIPDYYEENHGDLIADRFGYLPFLTGGSGLVGALGRQFVGRQKREAGGQRGKQWNGTKGPCLMMAGSCSAMTLRQIQFYQQTGGPSRQVTPEEILEGNLNEEQLLEWAKGKSQPVLFYSSAAPGERREVRAASSGSAGEVAGEIEAFFARLARKGAERGFTRMIVAGGETSGAVTKGLGYDSFYIGTEIAPGVPMMIPCGNTQMRLVLKSGNFGQEDFFCRAVEMTAGREEDNNGE